MKGRIGLLASSVLAAGLLTLAAIGTAFAADPTLTPGAGPRGPVAGSIGGWGGGAGSGSVLQALEKLTGLNAEEIKALRESGKSAAQIANDKGVSEETLLNEVLAARKTALDEAVKAGRITQERADYMLKNMTERVKEGLNRTEVGPRGARGSGVGPARTERAGCPFAESGQGLGPGRMGRWGASRAQ